MRMFINSKNKYLSNDMKIFGTCSIPLSKPSLFHKQASYFVQKKKYIYNFLGTKEGRIFFQTLKGGGG